MDLTPDAHKRKGPKLSAWEHIEKQRRHATVANFQNEMALAHRGANAKLQARELEAALYTRLTPGMRDRLLYRKAVLEAEIAKSMLPVNDERWSGSRANI